MNGFTNAILSLLLGWIRLLINQLWRTINSEGGASFFSFLARHWMTILLALCVGGFIVDKIVYVLRWRPYILWRGRRRRNQNGEGEPYAPEIGYADDAPAEPVYPMEQPTGFYQRPAASTPPVHSFDFPEQPTALYQRPAASYGPAEATQHYAPAFQRDAAPFAAQSALPLEEVSPIFDDDPADWPAEPEPSFGAGVSGPGKEAYIRDAQAGFARPLSPEQLYAPGEPAALETRTASSVHPGLDDQRIRENVGLLPAGSLPGPGAVPAVPVHTFAPFIAPEQPLPNRAHHPLAALAKKARGFVGVGDEDDPRTIRDLQPAVDMRTAFHEPVYPKPHPAKEDDDISTY